MIPFNELNFTYVRSSGPGGQKVNKTNSCAILSWNVRDTYSLSDEIKRKFMRLFTNKINSEGVLILRSDRFRNRNQNREDCIEKLAELLTRAAHKEKPRVATKPTKSSKKKRLQTKKIHSEKKRSRTKPNHE